MAIRHLICAVAIVTGFAMPAIAQASFHLAVAPGGPVYWDAASIARSGNTFKIDILQPYLAGTGPKAAVRGAITRHKISCDWSASVGGTLGRRTIDAAGKTIDSSGPEPFEQGSFYGPHGWHVIVTPVVCSPGAITAKGMNAMQALTDARSRLASRAAAEPDMGRAPAPPASDAPARFGLIRAEEATGNMSFLDWSRITRGGDTISVQVLDVLGDNTPPPPELQWKFSVIALRTLRLDCKARTLTQTAYVTFTKYLEPGDPDAKVWPVRTSADWPLGAQLLDAACSGAAPEVTYPSRAAAIAYQRSVHPLRK